jgi:hypothetical protein
MPYGISSLSYFCNAEDKQYLNTGSYISVTSGPAQTMSGSSTLPLSTSSRCSPTGSRWPTGTGESSLLTSRQSWVTVSGRSRHGHLLAGAVQGAGESSHAYLRAVAGQQGQGRVRHAQLKAAAGKRQWWAQLQLFRY